MRVRVRLRHKGVRTYGAQLTGRRAWVENKSRFVSMARARFGFMGLKWRFREPSHLFWPWKQDLSARRGHGRDPREGT